MQWRVKDNMVNMHGLANLLTNSFFFLFETNTHTVDCLDPSCSSHGVCIHGECHCNPGWGGNSCEILKTMCPDQCSGHGTYQAESGTCTCDANWTGPDCSIGNLYALTHPPPQYVGLPILLFYLALIWYTEWLLIVVKGINRLLFEIFCPPLCLICQQTFSKARLSQP